jgi:hypothetical protein
MLGLTLACSVNHLPTLPETVNTQTDPPLVYRSDRFKFSFSHPQDFAVTETDNGVDLWTVEENRAIQAGEYESGTELPPPYQHFSVSPSRSHPPEKVDSRRRSRAFRHP